LQDLSYLPPSLAHGDQVNKSAINTHSTLIVMQTNTFVCNQDALLMSLIETKHSVYKSEHLLYRILCMNLAVS